MDFLILWSLLQQYPIRKYHTDDWGAYSKYIPPSMHKTGKEKTWKIERKNLNFRTHLKRLNRKTICFSKNEQIHDNVIGMYIERYYYKTGTYGNNQLIHTIYDTTLFFMAPQKKVSAKIKTICGF
jgi:hypothetical protein